MGYPWSSGNTLVALDLNAEFGSVLGSLGSTNGSVTALSTALSNGLAEAFDSAYFSFASIAALRAATTITLPGPVCSLLGYYTAGDLGGGLFNLSTDTTSADNGGTIIVDASSRRWYRNLVGKNISVHFFGAKGDGATDDTAAIQAAFTLAGSAGVAVQFATLKYNTSSAIVVSGNTLVLGNQAQVQTTSATAHIFQLGTGTTGTIDNITFKDLYIWATVAKTGGAAFKAVQSLQNTNFLNVRAGSLENYGANGHRLWNGIECLNSFDRLWADQASFFICANYGIYCSSASTNTAAGFQLDAHILFCAIGAYVSGGVGGIYFNGEFSLCATSVQVDTLANGVANREIFFQPGAIIDSSVNYAINIAANSAAIVEMTGTWIAASGQGGSGSGVGFYIGADSGSFATWVRMTGCKIYNNASTGIVNNGVQMLIAGCFFQSNAGTYVVILEGANSGGSSIQACSFNNNTGTCIYLNSIPQYSIDGNNFFGNGGTVFGASWSSVQAVRNNNGYQTSNSGVAYITSGNSSVTFNHQLVGTPVCQVANGNDSTKTYSIGAVTSTQITVNSSAPASGGSIAITWFANMGTNS